MAEPERDKGRVLAIDYGTRRIGLALSDPTGTLATPLCTLPRRRGKRPPTARILEIASGRRVGHLVLGLPRAIDGSDNSWTEEVRDFGRRLEARSGLPVHLVDEECTSVEARARIGTIGPIGRKRKDKARIDAAAAAIILQEWLDERRPAEAAPVEERSG